MMSSSGRAVTPSPLSRSVSSPRVSRSMSPRPKRTKNKNAANGTHSSSTTTNTISNGTSNGISNNSSNSRNNRNKSPSSSSIQVVVRLRPMNSSEKEHGTIPVVTASTEDKSVTVMKGQGTRQVRSHFSFDKVFTAFSTQEEVFNETLKPVIADVLMGYESTVFAYGQTGTGKTYTMEGDLDDPQIHGIIPRSAQAIFDSLQNHNDNNNNNNHNNHHSQYSSYTVTCSYLEIYNEELSDLLLEPNNNNNNTSHTTPTSPAAAAATNSFSSPHSSTSTSTTSPTANTSSTDIDPKTSTNTKMLFAAAAAVARAKRHHHHRSTKLEIMEGKTGTFCRGLSEQTVHNAQDVLTLMQKAQQQRHIGETKMNKKSSRSHCLFTMKVRAKKLLPDGNTLEFNGKLHLVDLAGSESAKTAAASSSSSSTNDVAEVARGRERMNINRSLLTLGRVIKMLKERDDDLASSSPSPSSESTTTTPTTSSSSSKKKSSSSSNVFIPYRESKLTRILQEALGGRCKTVIVATLSPSLTAVEESISTLNYAQWANGITNKPISTTYLTVNNNNHHNSLLLSPSSSSGVPGGAPGGTGVGGGVDGSGNGITVEDWNEMECRLAYMQAQVEEAQGALARKHLQQQDIIDRADKAELELQQCQELRIKEQDIATKTISSLQDSLVIEQDCKNKLSIDLKKTETSLMNQTQRAEKAEMDYNQSELIRHQEKEESTNQINTLQQTLQSERSIKDALQIKCNTIETSLTKQTNRANNAETNLSQRTKELMDANTMIDELNEQLSIEIQQKLIIAKRYRDTEISLRKSSAVLYATQQTEYNLSNEISTLLQTLNESMKESEQFYNQIIQYIQIETKKRVATQIFYKSTKTIIMDMIQLLDKTFKRMELYQSSFIQNCTNEYKEKDRMALDESLMFVCSIMERITAVSSALDKTITSNTNHDDHNNDDNKKDEEEDVGLISKISQTRSNITKSIHKATDTLTESEKVLVSSCEVAREKLYTHASRIKDLESIFLSSSKTMIIDLEQRIMDFKTKLSQLTSSASNAISTSMITRKQKQDILSSLVSEWKNTSIQSSKSIHDKATLESKSIHQSYQTYNENIKNHNHTIQSTLTNQQSYIQNEGSYHMKSIINQESLLTEQSFDITRAQNKQKQLCDDIIQNVMIGVKDLVTSQIDLLTKEQCNHFALLEEKNDSLLGMNKSMNESGKDLLEQIQCTNTILCKTNDLVQKQEEDIIETMKQVNNTLDEVQKSTLDQMESITSYSSQTNETLTSMEDDDTISTERILSNLTSNQTDCYDHLSNTIHTKTQSDLSSLTSLGKDIVSYHKDDLIPNSIKALNRIEAPRGEMTSNLTSSMNLVLQDICDGETIIKGIGRNQQDLINNHLQLFIKEKDGMYRDMIRKEKDRLNMQYESIYEELSTFGVETSSLIVSSKTNTKIVDRNIYDFTSNILECYEDDNNDDEEEKNEEEKNEEEKNEEEEKDNNNNNNEKKKKDDNNKNEDDSDEKNEKDGESIKKRMQLVLPIKKNWTICKEFPSTVSKEEIYKDLSFESIDEELFGQIGNGDIGQQLQALIV